MAKYLGFWLGPAATARKNLFASCSKLFHRILEISSSPVSSTAAIAAANRDAMTALTCVGQLIEPPPEQLNLQLATNFKIMKIPYRSFGKAIYGFRSEFGIQVPLKSALYLPCCSHPHFKQDNSI